MTVSTALLDCTILLVDDEEANLDLLEAFLEADGYRRLVRTGDAREAIPLFDSVRPDLVLLDLHMPHRSGYEILRDIREHTPAGDYLPVLVLTADITDEAKERALSGGARDFLVKPLDGTETLLRVRNLLETRLLHRDARLARDRAEEAALRSELLAEASRVLGASLDCTTALSQLTRLLIPRIADACALLLHENGECLQVSIVHADPEQEPVLREAVIAPDTTALLASVLRGERAGRVPELPGGEAVGAGGPGCTLAAPLRLQGRTIGGLVLVRQGEGCDFDPEEVELAEELAARSVLAVENARLFANAEWATRARERMLSVVAHDLRNPLSVVSMYTEMLLSMLPPEGNAYQREALQSVFHAAERMQILIEDLLNASKLQQGSFALERLEQPAGGLFREAERMLRPLADTRQIELRFQGTNPSESVEVDGARLLQVLSNLIGNALKFTPEGGRVTVAWMVDDHLRVSVADSGPGIPPEQLPHIFGAFWQAQETDRRGVGLGLWIARAIVEGHGGQIWVDSGEGEGAAFHFTVPRTASQPLEGVGHLTHAPPLAPA